MAIFTALATFALRQVAGDGAENVLQAVIERFSDQGRLLIDALRESNERAWKALEVALAGEAFWNKLDPAEDRALRQQVRDLLDSIQLPRQTDLQEFRHLCLRELRDARKTGLLGGTLEELARSAGPSAGRAEQLAVLDRERAALREMASTLAQAGHKNLAWLLNQEPEPGQALLVMAVRYFFRRAVETTPELARSLQFTRMENLTAAQANGFRQLEDALRTQGQRLDRVLEALGAVMAETRDTVLDVKEEQKRHGNRLDDIYRLLRDLLEQAHMQQRREVRPGDSRSMRGPGERQHLRELVVRYQALPEEERRQRPALLNAVGMLRVAAGQCQEAQSDFEGVAELVRDAPRARAQARHNAYQAALERRDFAAALTALREAAALDPDGYAPFPFRDYAPERILGAGGFGVAFLCRHAALKRLVVVKTLWVNGLDRAIDDVFREAQVLNDLDHPAIIRLRDCRFADAGHTRPYLVMDYFESISLAAHVAQHGPLTPEELLPVARTVAEALQAAHAQGILHRDVKPDNLLVRRDPAAPHPGRAWQVRLIDFGLAVKQEVKQATARSPAGATPTPYEYDFAGTIDYAAPEQMGRLPGSPVGTYSDVYGFGKTCYFALLGTPEPDDSEKETLDEAWRKLLSQCTARKVESRIRDFAAVLARLREVEEALVGRPRARPVRAPALLAKAEPVEPPPPPRIIESGRKPAVENVPPRYIETPPTPARPASPKAILSGMWSNTPPDETSGATATGTDKVEDAASPPAFPPPRAGKRGPVGALFEQPSGARPNESEESPAEEPPVTAEGLPAQVEPKKSKPDLLGGAFLFGEEEPS